MSTSEPTAEMQSLQEAIDRLHQISIPAGSDFHYSNSFGAFRGGAAELRGRVSNLIFQLQERYGSQKLDAHAVEDPDDGDALGQVVEGLLDDLLEGVDVSLDRARALNKQAGSAGKNVTESGPVGAVPVPGQSVTGKKGKGGFVAAHLDHTMGSKVQEAFEVQPDNSNVPYVQDSALRRQHVETLEDLTFQDWQLEAQEPQLPQGLDVTPLTYIDTAEGLHGLAASLIAVREIAVDLEAHSYRSFQGFCCLMQLSTRVHDYLIDVIALRSHVGPVLGPIFANAKVVKVLHGADSDIVWLQRDFGIYTVNLFDTGQAARVLQFPSAGLAYLLSRFCSVKADKRWQLADWRIRPLSEEALLYARMDTHYLLYIYDRIKVDLLAHPRVPDHLQAELPSQGPHNLLGTVLERSRKLCLQQYQKELFTDTSYIDAYRKGRERLSKEQLAVYAGLFAWRDRMSRQHDESLGFVLPNALLLKLSMRMPSTMRDFRAALGNHGRKVAPIVSDLASEVVEVISSALKGAEHAPDPDVLLATAQPPASKALGSGQATVQAVVEKKIAFTGQQVLEPATAAASGSKLGQNAAKATPAKAAARSEAAQLAQNRSTEATAAGSAAADAAKEAPGAQVPQLVPKQLAALRTANTGSMLGAKRGSSLGTMLAGRGGTQQPAHVAPGNSQLTAASSREHLGRQVACISAAPAAGKDVDAGESQATQSDVTAAAAASSHPSNQHGQAIPAAPVQPPLSNAPAEVAASVHTGKDSGSIALVPKALAQLNARNKSLLASVFGKGRAAGAATASLVSLDQEAAAQHPSVIAQRSAAVQGSHGNAPSAQRPMLAGSTPRGDLANAAPRKQEEAAKSVVEALKAHFALPFALSGSPQAPVRSQDARSSSAQQGSAPQESRNAVDAEKPDEDGEGGAPVRTSAASMRAVMDQLASHNRFEVLVSADGSPGDASGSKADLPTAEPGEGDDFLPLPISEQFKLPSKKARRAEQQQGLRVHSTQAGAVQSEPQQPRKKHKVAGREQGKEGQKHLNRGPPGESAEAGPTKLSAQEREKQRHAAQVQATLQKLVVSRAPAEGSSCKVSHKGERPAAASSQEGVSARQVDASAKVVSVDCKGAQGGNEQPAGNEEERGAEAAQPIVAFDFEAARQSSKGLDILGGTSRGAHAGGRGRGRSSARGRGERGGAAGADKRGGGREGRKRKGFSPWESFQEEAIRGGKRSAVMPRSGNRNMTFS